MKTKKKINRLDVEILFKNAFLDVVNLENSYDSEKLTDQQYLHAVYKVIEKLKQDIEK